jgi:hypothetical protein
MEKEPQPGSIVPVFSRHFKVVIARFHGLARASAEPDAGKTRCADMRNEEYTMELFLAVGLIAATLAGAAGLFEVGPSSAASTPPAEMARLEPVRVVGTPFVPNTRPSER